MEDSATSLKGSLSPFLLPLIRNFTLYSGLLMPCLQLRINWKPVIQESVSLNEPLQLIQLQDTIKIKQYRTALRFTSFIPPTGISQTLIMLLLMNTQCVTIQPQLLSSPVHLANPWQLIKCYLRLNQWLEPLCLNSLLYPSRDISGLRVDQLR